jgi:hypothetical protein
MVNKEKYDKADPTTKKMVDAFVKCLEAKFPNQQISIKKSGYDGVCGIQSGARTLLNPTYGFNSNLKNTDKILVMDDFKVSGSSLKETFKLLIESGVPEKNITGYVLGLKR